MENKIITEYIKDALKYIDIESELCDIFYARSKDKITKTMYKILLSEQSSRILENDLGFNHIMINNLEVE